MEGQHGKKRQTGKIRLGRLAVDPVFFIIFVFFLASSLLLLGYMLLSSR
ncbi:MAG: hypothetical protein K6T65_09885 [Peptococcaceae bacterium]|nr:hypothetical protein [Peptococcaceae bacterium]